MATQVCQRTRLSYPTGYPCRVRQILLTITPAFLPATPSRSRRLWSENEESLASCPDSNADSKAKTGKTAIRTHSGHWPGVPVASLHCQTLRLGIASIDS